jgi:hypothetical protein
MRKPLSKLAAQVSNGCDLDVLSVTIERERWSIVLEITNRRAGDNGGNHVAYWLAGVCEEIVHAECHEDVESAA